MPMKEFHTGDGKTQFIRTLDGRKGMEHHYDDLDAEETYKKIDERRNVVVPNFEYGGNRNVEGDNTPDGEYFDDEEHP